MDWNLLLLMLGFAVGVTVVVLMIRRVAPRPFVRLPTWKELCTARPTQLEQWLLFLSLVMMFIPSMKWI